MPIEKHTRMLGAAMLALAVSACGSETAPAPDASAAKVDVAEPDTEEASAEPAKVVRPALRGPIEVANITEAHAELTARRGLSVQDASGAQIEQITWPYGPCLDAATLIPPPREGWGILTDLSLGEWPIAPDNARIAYHYADSDLEPGSDAYRSSERSVGIYVSSTLSEVAGLEQFLSSPAMRDVAFEPGPFNYPVRKDMNSALLGSYIVLVEGNDEGAEAYLETIIRCGIESGLIAKGVDLETLTLD